jgi:hypothetical protein
MIAVDYAPGFEERAGRATPLARCAAFIADLVARLRRPPTLRTTDPAFGRLVEPEASRLRRDHPDDWAAGSALLAVSGLA